MQAWLVRSMLAALLTLAGVAGLASVSTPAEQGPAASLAATAQPGDARLAAHTAAPGPTAERTSPTATLASPPLRPHGERLPCVWRAPHSLDPASDAHGAGAARGDARSDRVPRCPGWAWPGPLRVGGSDDTPTATA